MATNVCGRQINLFYHVYLEAINTVTPIILQQSYLITLQKTELPRSSYYVSAR